MTPEEALAIIERLADLDFGRRRDRERARDILAPLAGRSDLPPELVDVIGQTQAALESRSGTIVPPAPQPEGQVQPGLVGPDGQTVPIDPSVTIEAFVGQLDSSDGVGFYGVDPFTMDEDGAVVPWEAIVGNATVAPQYPQGWSRQPQRFGINNEESIARAQIMMEEAGLLQPGTYRLGVWDVRTAGRSNEEGWRAVLSFANVTGQEWDGAFNQLYTAGTDASARGLRMQLERLSREPMYTDPDAMRARTRQFLRQMGRRENEITEEEVDTIMRAAAVGSQQMQIDTLQQRIDQTQMQAEGYSWDPAQAITGGMQGPLPIEPVDIDPARSFDTALEGVMGREISARQSQQEAAEGQRDFSSIAQAFGSAFSR